MADTGWAKKAAKNLLPLSEEQDRLPVALDEWFYSGINNDLEHERSSCGLCEYPDIRYEFEIVNRHNGNALLVGSECITRLEIPAVDQQGRLLEGVAAKQKVAADRRALVRRAAHKRVVTSLLQLGREDSEFAPKIESFVAYYSENTAFTLSQLATVLWRLGKARIAHNRRDFRMKIRRDREKAQLRAMKDWQVKQIWDCMTKAQQDWYSSQRGEE